LSITSSKWRCMQNSYLFRWYRFWSYNFSDQVQVWWQGQKQINFRIDTGSGHCRLPRPDADVITRNCSFRYYFCFHGIKKNMSRSIRKPRQNSIYSLGQEQLLGWVGIHGWPND
jgi:hypothetical protein